MKATTPAAVEVVAGWAWRGACVDRDPEIWFPHESADADYPKSICGQCPVLAQCLAYALDVRPEHGIWGGTTPDERDALLRASGRVRARLPIVHGTEAGFSAHRRRGEETCNACRDAAVAANQERKEKREANA